MASSEVTIVDNPTRVPSATVLHVEVRLFPSADGRLDSVIRWVHAWLHANFISLSLAQDISCFDDSPLIAENVEIISVVEATGSAADVLYLENVVLDIHAYKLHPDVVPSVGPSQESDDGDHDEQPSSKVTVLPSKTLDGLWEFRALAQKLSIRLSKRFSHCQLVEINSHSLFSKWFSESGKLVGRMFEEIMQMLADEDTFVVVLIVDEVESLTSARKGAASGNEPSDSLRVVNALLTALDRLRYKNNVIILTTSNLIEAMDPAFLDRADIKQFVGAPTTPAVYTILRTCLNELIRCGLIEEQSLARRISYLVVRKRASPCFHNPMLLLHDSGGRTLRRLPVLMHAAYIQRDSCSLVEALGALERVVEDERKARGEFIV
ncbi:hypothetical protein Q9L58_009582 [Maublancomyces gigas]|uniref:ATPase AAA-type core domain-containing protein n=1 Tax=Discina gigas TaxID=1032678 RepID=A0ABR3G6H2_9PEZI